VLTYSLTLGGVLQFTLRVVTECESHFTAVERLLHYAAAVPLEPAIATARSAGSDQMVDSDGAAGDVCKPQAWDTALVAAGWPERGAVAFDGVCVRYRPDLPLVLRGLSFRAESGDKIGIVGRTGLADSLWPICACAARRC
jgi:ABC-type multidrug transport system fused ATPase/permease subunit